MDRPAGATEPLRAPSRASPRASASVRPSRHGGLPAAVGDGSGVEERLHPLAQAHILDRWWP